MKVYLNSIADLRDTFGRGPQEIELKDDAILQDLLYAIDERWGRVLPSYLWNSTKKQFRGPVYFLINKEVIQDMHTPLKDGLQIDLMKALVGG